MRRAIVFLGIFLAAAVWAQTPAQPEKRVYWVAENYHALPQLKPELLKSPQILSGVIRNPFRQAVQVNETKLPPAKARQDAGSRLKSLLAERVRSVVRSGVPLVAIDDGFFQVGDEVLIKNRAGLEPPLAGAHVKLTKINDDNLTFTVYSDETEAGSPWEVAVIVPLSPFMRAKQ